MEKYFFTALIILTGLLFQNLTLHSSGASAQSLNQSEVLGAAQPIHTTSKFETKLETKVEKIERDTTIKDDPERELDDDITLEEGKDGERTTVWKIFFYEGKEYSKEILSTEEISPEDKIISHGTKIVWRTLSTPDGGAVNYWRKLRVWATSYDSHCPGCDETTATGLRAGKGVIAVDPRVIKLGSRVYISGYGLAVAGDTGGAIKGNIIDLGFEDSRSSGWQSHFVDVYLLQ